MCQEERQGLTRVSHWRGKLMNCVANQKQVHSLKEVAIIRKKMISIILGASVLILLLVIATFFMGEIFPGDAINPVAKQTESHSSGSMTAGAAGEASARDYYVSPQGKDANPGTMNAPLASIQKAIELVKPGGSVMLLEGVYHQTVSIDKSGSSDQGYISLRSAKGHTAVMDGKGVQPVENGVIHIDNASYVRVEGLEIRHYDTSSAVVTPIGIHVSGSGRNIEIIGNRVHDMGTHAGRKAGGGNAHGIAVYGNSADPLKQIAIIENELYNLKLGASEAMVINGNVDGFRVTKNLVHHNNNIGVDIIGFEGTGPNPAQDQARNGVIQENQVYNNSSYGNPAYGNDYSAAGIYVDGGKDIKIIDNDIHDNDFGIELASEHAGGSTSNVEVSLNRIYNNSAAGITLGGYDEDRGRTENCIIKENEFTENNTKHLGYGEINLAFDTRNNEMRNNSIQANEDGLMITNEFTQNEGNIVDFNHYSSKNQSLWIWKGEEYDDFSTYRTQTGNDLHSKLNLEI
ncbi:MAG: right-handed parallel beta-helix repeat-containing protein [Paenibacillus lautus]|uniref:DUF1565 domain-containing protein n=1 Tax=Paenibacillus lautus TaxID=1401 RepID=UPI0010D7974E|nr:right-handed parallel beta-helix repeat-containing protein [Paenibacillus lautus]MCI1773619.1 right-handed parallel beta-helix repeat-containing protein [Paenibacillus lautus]VTR18731.1 Pectate disaccharide-lyase precursor [Actinobacillus pleuropneumoniae]